MQYLELRLSGARSSTMDWPASDWEGGEASGGVASQSAVEAEPFGAVAISAFCDPYILLIGFPVTHWCQ